MRPPSRSRTLLVVDGCAESQARIHELVDGRGFNVITAPHPSAALPLIDLAAPDIVITDLFLPEGSGLTLTQAMRARRERCPVIVTAEAGTEPAVVQALRAGAVDYLEKPIGVEQLAHALQRARQMLPLDLAETAGILSSESRLTMDSDPVHIPGVVSWLIHTTTSTLPETTRLHLRGALQELLFNAVEHGNLEVYYHDKQRALAENRYDDLLAKRLAIPRYRDRTVTVHVQYDQRARRLRYRIADEGKGFKWRGILHRAGEICPSEDVNGRGIFLARSFFPDLTYNERGNEVSITVPLE